MRGGDFSGLFRIYLPYCFNPRPRARGRRGAHHTVEALEKFQSTPPCEGATQGLALLRGSQRFNPRPRARGRRWRVLHPPKDDCVSIHAPVRGGDRLQSPQRVLGQVSIHAPVRGGDKPKFGGCKQSLMFQSTPPCEGATDTEKGLLKEIRVSIHAPVRGGD